MSTSFTCRSCHHSHGQTILDLGIQPLANNLLTPKNLEGPEPQFPLRVAVCEKCWLLQISDLVPPVEMFSEYLYFSSFSDALLRHSREAAERHCEEFSLGEESLVVEIASNDGYMLQNFKAAGVPCLGIEPAANIAKVAEEKGIESIVEFFGEGLARKLQAEGRQADLILGNNVFAHAPDTNDFVAGLQTLLKARGRIVLEFPYGADLIEHTEFDTIYHEHVFYFTLLPLLPLFQRHGLSLFRVVHTPIHGGSLRLFACHEGDYPVEASIQTMEREEREKGIDSLAYYEGFAGRVQSIRAELRKLLLDLKQQGRSIAAYGASAKGSTLLNYLGLDAAQTIDFVTDRSSYKQGRLTPGTHLPIVAAEELGKRQPDYTLLLTWNFADEILAQQMAYRATGGRFIVPIPQVKVLA